MNTATDTLDILKAKYLGQIKAKELEISALREKLSLLDELKREAESMELSLPGLPEELKKNLAVQNTNGPGLTQSVLAAISRFPDGLKPPRMRKYLLENGFKPSGKNFNVSVGTTLNRLATSGKILIKEVDGRKLFFPKR